MLGGMRMRRSNLHTLAVAIAALTPGVIPAAAQETPPATPPTTQTQPVAPPQATPPPPTPDAVAPVPATTPEGAAAQTPSPTAAGKANATLPDVEIGVPGDSAKPAQKVAKPAKQSAPTATKTTVRAPQKAKPAAPAPAPSQPAETAQAAASDAQPSLPDDGSAGASTPAGAVDGYVAKEGISGTKTATPLQEIPQSISTVTRKQIEDRKPQDMSQALSYVPGVRVNVSGYDPRFDSFNIRGFDATYSGIYRDGLRQLYSGFGQFRTEIYGLDSITILRGPVGSLYGAGNAGGIVDMYSKRPSETPFHELEFIVGNHNRYQTNFDFSDVAGGGNVLYRMTGIYRDADTEALGVPDDRLYLAPSFTFKLDPDTKVTLFGEYMDAKSGANMAWLNDYSDPNHTRRTNIWSGDPNFNSFDQTQERLGVELEHRLGDGLMFRQKARYSHLQEFAKYIDVVEEIAPDVWSRMNGTVDSHVHTVNSDSQLEARFATGPIGHTVIAGVDIGYITFKEGNGFGDPIGDGGDVPPLVNFNYGQVFIPTPPISTITYQDQFLIGTYLQDQVKLDRWTLTLGGRHDWSDTKTDIDGDVDKQKDKAWSGRAGLSYLFDGGLAPYIAYGTGFIPNAGVDSVTGTPFSPTTSKSKEVGFKYLVPGANASLNGAVFDIEQTGGLVTDPQTQGSTQLGTLRARGFELETVATVAPGFSLQASYTYLQMKIIEGFDDSTGESTAGKIQSSSPAHTFSIWGDYTLQEGALRGFGFGAGVRYIGTSFGNDRNSFKNDAQALMDATVHYDLASLGMNGARLQLNVTNVFDKQADVCSFDYCYLDQGRTVLGSLRYRW